MKEGDTVVLVGLVKATHLNGKVATVAGKHEKDRWIVNLFKDAENKVATDIIQ